MYPLYAMCYEGSTLHWGGEEEERVLKWPHTSRTGSALGWTPEEKEARGRKFAIKGLKLKEILAFLIFGK